MPKIQQSSGLTTTPSHAYRWGMGAKREEYSVHRHADRRPRGLLNLAGWSSDTITCPSASVVSEAGVGEVSCLKGRSPRKIESKLPRPHVPEPRRRKAVHSYT